MAEDGSNNAKSTQTQIDDNIDSKQTLQKLLEETHPDWNFQWKRIGNQIRGYCPFHNDNHKPNLYIADKGEGAFYKCFACGASGSLRSLKRLQENPDHYKKIEEQKYILQITGLLAKFFAENLTREEGDDIHRLTRDTIIEYLYERNDQIYNAVQNKIIIGFVPRNFNVEDQINQFYKNREININFDQLTDELKTKLKLLDNCGGFLVFFYTDIDGNITEFKLRNVIKEDEYRSNKQIYTINFIENDGNSGFLLSSIGNAKRFTEIYIVEGEFDALSVYAYFSPDEEYSSEEEIITEDNTLHIVSAGGLDNMYNLAKTLATEKYIPILIPDFDRAGQNSILKIIENAKRDKMMDKIAAVILDEDNRDLVNKVKDLDELFKTGSRRATFFANIQLKLLDEIVQYIKKKEEEEIIKEISQKPKNIQNILLKIEHIDPEKINVTKVRKMDVLEVMDEPLPPLDFIMPGLKARTVGVFYASSGLGKSFLSLEIAAAVAGAPDILSKYENNESNVNLFSIKKHGKVTYLSLEDDMDVLKIRVKKIMHYIKMIYKDRFDDIKETLRKNFNVVSLFGSGITIANPDKVVEYCKDSRLAVIDTLSRFNNYEENSNTEMAKFIVELEKIIVKTDSSFLVIHHITKNKDDEGGNSRGAGAIDSNSRFKCTLTTTPDENLKLFAIKKANYGASEQKVYMKKLNDEDYIDEIQNNNSIANSSFNFGGILVPVKTSEYTTYDDDNEIYSDKSNTQKQYENVVKEKKSKSPQSNDKNNNKEKIIKKQSDNNTNGNNDGDSML